MNIIMKVKKKEHFTLKRVTRVSFDKDEFCSIFIV